MSKLSVKFRMPAEWEPHSATLLAWPHEVEDWPGKFEPIPWVYAEIIRRLVESEPVLLLVQPGAEADVRSILQSAHCDLAKITFLTQPTDRIWMRDSGPIGVLDTRGDLVLLDWRFNAWAKYDNWKHDNEVPKTVAAHLHETIFQPSRDRKPIVLEGGGIDVNGEGLILTTEEWLLSESQIRNPGFMRSDYDAVFAEFLGANRTIWLGCGIAGDDTHGHVDDIARFVAPRTVVAATEANPHDPNHEPLKVNLDRLRNFRDERGGLNVVEIPMPEPVWFRAQRLPASYANFFIANSAVLVPTFNDPNDYVVLGTLAELFPTRHVIGIHALDLVWGLGTLHCLSQQIPAKHPIN